MLCISGFMDDFRNIRREKAYTQTDSAGAVPVRGRSLIGLSTIALFFVEILCMITCKYFYAATNVLYVTSTDVDKPFHSDAFYFCFLVLFRHFYHNSFHAKDYCIVYNVT